MYSGKKYVGPINIFSSHTWMENARQESNFIIFQECPHLQIEELCPNSLPCLCQRRRALHTATVCATSSHHRQLCVLLPLPSFLITIAPPDLYMYFLLLMFCLLHHKFPFLQLIYSHWQDSWFLMENRIYFYVFEILNSRLIFAPHLYTFYQMQWYLFCSAIVQSLFSYVVPVFICIIYYYFSFFLVENHALPLWRSVNCHCVIFFKYRVFVEEATKLLCLHYWRWNSHIIVAEVFHIISWLLCFQEKYIIVNKTKADQYDKKEWPIIQEYR